MEQEIEKITAEQLVEMVMRTTALVMTEAGFKDFVKKGMAGAGIVAALAGAGSLQSCEKSRYEPNWNTEVLSWDQRIEHTWNLHNERGDWENIEDGVGFCFWCGTRCANSGGGWTVCVVFKDKSTGQFILPQDAKRPNDKGLDNEYTTDRIDTRGLESCGGGTCGTPTNENKTTHNMKLTQKQIDEAVAKATTMAIQEAQAAGLSKEEISVAAQKVVNEGLNEYYHGDDVNIQLSNQENEVIAEAEGLLEQLSQLAKRAQSIDWDAVAGGDENFDRASRGNAMWRLGHVLSQARLNLVHAIRDVKHEPSPYAHPSYDE